ncbi:general secretion pathway protein GspM [Pseudomonas sp. S31]|uniref:type II secretion system protein GspM n=1 Tax=Pseudomonas sp. S31 TaxID=1564473 RepID=UPI001912960F|nr:type II secretion system protein GspM [Pseudomonas sp. S31]MBK5002062.1 general secretion pathway protein GspM [Pseudomonas sp. S31]
MRPLTPRERRIAALGVLGLLLWAAWYLLVESLLLTPLRELDDQIETLREQQRHYASLLAQQPLLEAQLQRSKASAAKANSLLPGNDPNAAAAELMQYATRQVARQAAQGLGCEVTQRMPVTPAEHTTVEPEPYRQVKVSLTLSCAIEPLAGLLHTLEYGQPALFIDQLSVRRSASAPAHGGAGRLDVQVLIRGYLRGRGAE